MKSNLKCVVVMALMPGFLFFFTAVKTKALCVTETIKTKQLLGNLIDSNGNPFPNIKIDLRKTGTYDTIVKTIITGEEGKFDFGLIKSGKYTIYLGHGSLRGFAFEVKHKLKKKVDKKEPILKITVGLGFSGCGGWSAAYGSQRT